jgi:FlaA1/EpsC-like NDP-sugar epimerase
MSNPILENHAFSQRVAKRVRHLAPLATSDLLVMLIAYIVTHSVRLETTPGRFDQQANLFFGVNCLIMFITLYSFGGYNRIWSRTSGHDVKVIVYAVLTTTVVSFGLDLLIKARPLPLSVAVVMNIFALTGFVAVRYRSRLISGLSWRWRAVWHEEFPGMVTRVLIIGAGDAGQTTAWRLKHRHPKEHKYRVVGFVDDDPAKQKMYVEGCPVLGTRSDIPHLVEKHAIDLIVFAIHNIPGLDFREVLAYCERTPAQIKLIPDVFALINGKTNTSLLRDLQPEDLLGRPAVAWHEGVDTTPVANKVVLVTGAAGSIGSELCRQLLLLNPTRLIMLDNNESGLHDLLTELSTDTEREKLVPFLADITNRSALTRVFSEYHPQVIFHSAAYKHVPMMEIYPQEAIRVNIGGTQQVAGLARDHGVERFVLISTDKAVNPSSIMGASKRICELLMHAMSQQSDTRTLFTSVRFGNVLNSRGSVVPTFNRQIDEGGPVTVTDKDMTRYFMTIPEAVNLVIHAACLTTGDDLFMLRMGEVVRIVDLAERMIRLRGLRPYRDIPIHFTGVRPGEKLNEELHSETEMTIPTVHPGIVELVCSHNGLQPTLFSDRINGLFQTGLHLSQSPLEQLREIIALGSEEFAAEKLL